MFQDHVAARYCLEMTLNDGINEVWCETIDDITILRSGVAMEEVEFVQVKGTNSEHLWSIAQACQRQSSQEGSSLVERSLANDRCREPCTFSVVTTRGVRSELKPLTFGLHERARLNEILELSKTFLERLPDYVSPLGHNVAWWAERTSWLVLHDSEAVQDHNLRQLTEIAKRMNMALFPDQVTSVYDLVLLKVSKASALDKRAIQSGGKLKREEFAQWIKDQIREAYDAGRSGGPTLLKQKLTAAGLDDVAIANANELRRHYREMSLDPTYLDLQNMESWENEIRGLLNRLRARMDSGEIQSDGVIFHSTVLEAISEMRRSYVGPMVPSESSLQGLMYHITALCQHRFVRADL